MMQASYLFLLSIRFGFFMKIKLGLALTLLLTMFVLHVTCSQHAIDVQEIVEERDVHVIFNKIVVH